MYTFVENIILVDGTRDVFNAKLVIWPDTLEFKSFQLSKAKFSKTRNIYERILRLNGGEIPKT